MRKRIITSIEPETVHSDQNWLDIEAIAEVEITSEEPGHPIEDALIPNHDLGWYAATSGKQIIRLIFIAPQQLNLIRLNFVETQVERSQEYVLRWLADGGCEFHEIVRQQWNFSPSGATWEIYEHLVSIQGVMVLELMIHPI